MDNNELKKEEAKAGSSKKNKLLDDILDIAESTIITVFVVIMLMTYFLHPVQVVGSSMMSTLHPGDQIFMSTVNLGYSYGDIVIIDNDCAYLIDDEQKNIVKGSSGSFNECIIKRVIAKGGDTLDIDFETGEVTVNGKVMEEKFLGKTITTQNSGAFTYPLTVPKGYYFVMGDNRNNSCDSRHPNVGLIKKSQIYGKAICRYAEKERDPETGEPIEDGKNTYSFKNLIY